MSKLQRRIELCGDAPRAPMQPCKRRVWPPPGRPPAQGRSMPVQAQSEKSRGVRGTESSDSSDNTPKKPSIACPFFRGKYSEWLDESDPDTMEEFPEDCCAKSRL